MKFKNITYNQIVDDLRTFDIILMHGLLFSSRIIEIAEFSKWSHVGMVIRSEDIGLEKTLPAVLLWEATDYINLKDLILGISKTGPMLVGLHDRIKANQTNKTDNVTAVRYLNTERTPAMLEKLKKVIGEVHNTHLPSAPKLIQNLFKGRILHEKINHDKFFFCSELITYTYKYVGLMPETLPSNALEPKDFAPHGYLPLLKRSTLSKEMYFEP